MIVGMTKNKRISIGELSLLINRRVGTIRKWESEGKLPKKLMPKRTKGGHRYWTESQVKQIVEWMERKDIRPGNLLVHPDNTDGHIENLRRPKFINKQMAKRIIEQANGGYELDEIIDNFWPETKYSTPEGFESALRKWFDQNDWYLPEREREPTLDDVKRLR